MKPKYVYLVSTGYYSDYRINCVCSTIENAKEAKKLYAADDIEQFILDVLPEHPKNRYMHTVCMNKEGTTFFINLANSSQEERWFPSGHPEITSIIFFVWAKDNKHAVKIANEKRIQLLANNMWPKNYAEWRSKK